MRITWMSILIALTLAQVAGCAQPMRPSPATFQACSPDGGGNFKIPLVLNSGVLEPEYDVCKVEKNKKLRYEYATSGERFYIAFTGGTSPVKERPEPCPAQAPSGAFCFKSVTKPNREERKLSLINGYGTFPYELIYRGTSNDPMIIIDP